MFSDKITKITPIIAYQLSNERLFYAKFAKSGLVLLYFDYICKTNYLYDIHMTQEYARVSVEMPENEDKKSLRHALDLGRFACKELTYEIENNDIKDEFIIKF